jgi:succinylarginine dihydrolase
VLSLLGSLERLRERPDRLRARLDLTLLRGLAEVPAEELHLPRDHRPRARHVLDDLGLVLGEVRLGAAGAAVAARPTATATATASSVTIATAAGLARVADDLGTARGAGVNLLGGRGDGGGPAHRLQLIKKKKEK